MRSLTSDRVFLTNRGKPPAPDSLKNPWHKAVDAIGLNDPRPTIHDLRHVWFTNAMRSGVHPLIAETILGHSTGIAGVYTHVSDDNLRKAIDMMQFDFGGTEIWVAKYAK